MKHKIIVILMAAAMALPAMAQWSRTPFSEVIAPQASFQSTSTMQASGSRFSTNTKLNSDGTAIYGNGSGTQPQTQDPRVPRKVAPPVIEGEPTPLGDALLPLLLMAVLYTFVKRRLNVLA